ncbi:MAG: CapA family protein [Myxococcota bacterium]|nr:CapA family protein [Myxococcota bacterium]
MRSLFVSELVLCIALFSATASAQEAGARRVTIGASGDLLLHLRVIAAAEHAQGGWDSVLAALASIVTPEEIAFANLETPLSMERTVVTGDPPILGAPAEVAASLARAGLDLLSVANNHAYDQWASGMASTIEAVRAQQLGAVGAGPDGAAALAPFVVERDGARVAFVAITERVNSGPGAREPSTVIARWTDDAVIATALERARQGADLLVVSIHWSHDFYTEPTRTQRERAAFLVAHGADLILGHGPHVLHEVERLASPRGEALCAYSLGNLLSNQGMRYRAGRRAYPGAHIATWHPGTRDGIWLRTTIELEGGRVRIGRVEGVPLFTFNNYVARLLRETRDEDIRVQRLRDVADVALREERRAAIAEALGPVVTLVD